MENNNFKNFIEKYYINKDVIKDSSFKVIKKFMNLFKNLIDDNIKNDYFLNEIQKFNENDVIDNMENEYLNLIYILFLIEKNNNKDLIKEFYLKLFSITLNNYNLKRIILNFSIFKKNFNIIIKGLYNCYNDIINFIEVIKNEIIKHNENNKINILLFLFYCVLFSITQSKDLLIEPNYIDIIFIIPNILNLNLNLELNDIKLIISSIQNSFNYIFNKHFFLLQKLNNNQFELIKNYFIQKLLEKETLFYEHYVYIIENILYNDKNNSSQITLVTINILISNSKLLHKIALNILNKNLENKILDINFLKKFILIYDTLDGYNNQQFKSLYKDFEFIIDFINKKNNFKNEEIDEKNLFINPINYLIIFTKKLLKNRNYKIQKFFVKLFCKMNVTNEIFNSYLLSDFLLLINNPFFYPQNEIDNYDFKLGLIIENFYTKYFTKYPKYIIDFLNGIGKYITNEIICYYLVKSIENIIQKIEEIKDTIDNKLISYIEILIDKFLNNNKSYYYKYTFWNLISNLILKTNIHSEENYKNIYNIVYCELIIYMLNINEDYLSIYNLYFGLNENNIKNELYLKAIHKMNSYIKSNMNLSNITDKNFFIKDNNLEDYSIKYQNIIYYSISSSEILNDYINNNISIIFSSYIKDNMKKDILNNINCIFEISLIFKNYSNPNFDFINDVYLNLKTMLKNCNNFYIDGFYLYEKLLFNYITIFKKPFPDYLINGIEIVNTPQQLKYNLLFLKMYNYNLLCMIHYNIFKNHELINNKNLFSNINYIYNYLIKNYPSLNEINNILYLKNLTLCLLLMNYLNIQINFIDINQIFIYYEFVNNFDIFYLFQYFQIFFQKKYDDSNIENFQTFIDKSLNILIKNDENFNYINVLLFILTIIDKNKISNENYSNVIQNILKKFIILNDDKAWLLIKISSEILIKYIKEDNNLILIYDEILVEYSKIRELRGEDTFMIQTCPLYIKSPFNIKIKNILPYNDEISKFDLYVRIEILKFYEDLINNNLNYNQILIYSILNTINKVIKEIDLLSDFKPELELSDKHRKKLRLSQLLLTLGSIFNKETINFIKDNEIINSISNSLISILQKINIFSVDYYIYLFSIIFLKYCKEFRIFLLNSLLFPETKSYIVTSSLIISSISLIEKYIINEDEINQFINAITIQCTSNICNIRGYAQYFINKISNQFNAISNNYLSNSFLEYLNKNQNIQKFFKKFDSKYESYIFLLKNFSVDNILKNSYDEIYKEPISENINSKLKLLSQNEIKLDSQNYNILSNNYKYIFDNKIKEEIVLNPINNFPKKRYDIIILGSLLEKIPNLFGLMRTCEIFNIGALTIPSEDILNDKNFISSSSNSEKLIPLLSIPKVTVKEFIIAYRKLGYSIIGLEQTQNSIDIKKFEFKEKMVLVLGNEKEGIPQEIIDLIDNCIIINQFGEVRSLNVHVSAAIMIWECIKCLNKKKIIND